MTTCVPLSQGPCGLSFHQHHCSYPSENQSGPDWLLFTPVLPCAQHRESHHLGLGVLWNHIRGLTFGADTRHKSCAFVRTLSTQK